MKFAKTLSVKSPERGTEFSAGLDFFVPDNDDLGLFRSALALKNPDIHIMAKGFFIAPGQHYRIPSGIRVNMETSKVFKYKENEGYGLALICDNKSSVSELGITVRAKIIDQDYQGEIHLSVMNTTSEPIFIEYGLKLIQMLIHIVIIEDFEEETNDMLFNFISERGEGCFGSTGSK